MRIVVSAVIVKRAKGAVRLTARRECDACATRHLPTRISETKLLPDLETEATEERNLDACGYSPTVRRGTIICWIADSRLLRPYRHRSLFDSLFKLLALSSRLRRGETLHSRSAASSKQDAISNRLDKLERLPSRPPERHPDRPWTAIGPYARAYPQRMDEVRFEVAPAPAESGSGFQVLIFVNEVELTTSGAGLGMDPYDVLVPDNKFLPRPEPHTFGVARCGCGVYGCGATDITISADNDVVTWVWRLEVPINHPSQFALDPYLREVSRVGADHSWETPERTAGRLVLAQVDRTLLQRHGLTPSWVGNDWRAPEVFEICLTFEAAYQIFLRFPWNGDAPETLASRILAQLNHASGPAAWQATWHAMAPADRYQAPRIAQPGWTREGALALDRAMFDQRPGSIGRLDAP